MSLARFAVIGVFALLAGCRGDDPADVASSEVVAPSSCNGLRGGPPGWHSIASDLGRAHALTRYFGIEPSPRAVDLRLAELLDTIAPSDPAIARAYAEAIPQACVAPAEELALGPANVSLRGDVAVVRPGTGPLDVPVTAMSNVALLCTGRPHVDGQFQAGKSFA